MTPDKIPLFWGSFPVPYWIQIKGSSDIADKEGTYKAIRQGFEVWGLPSCTCLTLQDRGLTAEITLGYDQDHPEKNKNLVLFQKRNWVHAGSAVAVTTNIFNKKTGEIVAFDIEFNNAGFRFSLDGGYHQGPTIDVQNTLTHEAGHVFGLDHSPTPQATMFASAPAGQKSKRELHQEDIEGICAVYPKENGCGPYGPDSSSLRNREGCGCASQSPSPPPPPWSLFLFSFWALAWLIWRRSTLWNKRG